MKIDKRVGNLCFNEEYHKYWNEDTTTPYISVTTLIESYGQPFDKEFWSAYKAMEKLMDSDTWKLEKKNLLSTKKFNKDLLDLYDISESEFNKVQQNILDEWERKNKEACERGTKIHAKLEEAVLGHKKEFSLTKFGIGGKFICKGRDYHKLNLEAGAYPEYMIGREIEPGLFGLSGQIDLLLKKGNKIIIGDYKTNTEIKTKSYFDNKTKTSQKMLYPLNTLDDVNYWHYNLQLSTYAWMIQQYHPEFEVEDLVLIHFRPDGKQDTYHMEYLKDEVEKMINHYKKKLLHDKQIAKYQRIEY